MNRPWRVLDDALLLTLRLTPRGGRDGIDGCDVLADGKAVLRVRVSAAPTEGEANAALVKLIGKSLGLAPSRLSIASGATSRIKVLRIEGNPQATALALEALLARA